MCDIKLNDLKYACANCNSANKIIKILKVNAFIVYVNFDGSASSKIVKIRLNLGNFSLIAHIKLNKKMQLSRVTSYKVMDGWQVKILR